MSSLKEQRMLAAHQLGRRDYREGRGLSNDVLNYDAEEKLAYVAGYLGAKKRDEQNVKT